MMGCYSGFTVGGFPVLGLAGMTFSLLFLVAIASALIWAVRTLAPGPHWEPQAIEILKRRLAAGEISEADYQQAKRTLQG